MACPPPAWLGERGPRTALLGRGSGGTYAVRLAPHRATERGLKTWTCEPPPPMGQSEGPRWKALERIPPRGSLGRGGCASCFLPHRGADLGARELLCGRALAPLLSFAGVRACVAVGGAPRSLQCRQSTRRPRGWRPPRKLAPCPLQQGGSQGRGVRRALSVPVHAHFLVCRPPRPPPSAPGPSQCPHYIRKKIEAQRNQWIV